MVRLYNTFEYFTHTHKSCCVIFFRKGKKWNGYHFHFLSRFVSLSLFRMPHSIFALIDPILLRLDVNDIYLCQNCKIKSIRLRRRRRRRIGSYVSCHINVQDVGRENKREREKKKISRQFAYYCLLYIYWERIRIHNVDNWCIAMVEEQKGEKNSCKVCRQLLKDW